MAKIHFNGLQTFSTVGVAVLFIVMLSFFGHPTYAQPILGAQNIALGGGGTAYLSGYEALYWNPANLAINDRHGTVHIGLGHSGILHDPVLSSDAVGEQFFNFTDSFYPYKPSTVDITAVQRQTILDENYPRNRLTAQHQSRADIILGGVSWYRSDETFSISARARYSSRIKVGKGWYSTNFVKDDETEIRDLTLNQYIDRHIEIALGYAREFTFLEGLFPRLSKLYMGISPKFIIAGPSFRATHYGRYVREDNGSEYYMSDFTYRSTGRYSKMTFDYLSSNNPQTAINSNLNRKLNFKPTGYGAAFDFGLTYLIPIGGKLNILEDDPKQSVVGNSLRIAISVNDIGMVRYTDQPLELTSDKDSVQIDQEPFKQSMFIGSGGQYLTYFENSESLPNPFVTADSSNENNFSVLTPTSLNTGIMLDLQRIKFMGDLTLGFNNNAFTNKKLAMHLGMELRPLKMIPIRAGTRLASGLPVYVGFGTGIETRYWDFNVGTQIIFRSHTFTTEAVGGAFAGLQLHL